MPKQLTIDGRLIEEARKVGGHKTKKEAVSVALEEYIKRCKRRRIASSSGAKSSAMDWDPMFDYEAERRKKRA